MEPNSQIVSLSEDQVKVLAAFGGLCEVAIARSGIGARSTSQGQLGWSAWINGFPLRSARKNMRVFASVDTAIDTLVSLGVSAKTEIKIRLEEKRDAKKEAGRQGAKAKTSPGRPEV
jgi:hypothetical protein